MNGFKRLGFGLALVGLLAGCSATAGRPEGVSRISAALERDLVRAAEIAVAAKDEVAAKCFNHLIAVVKETNVGDLDANGIFSLLEKARVLRRGSTSTAAQDKFRLECGPLAADLMIMFARQGATRGMGGGGGLF